jgi:phosphoribosyl-AMP cyclohydrolase / phosphoribosyl-ATP pyrophosphohydrolase
MSWLDAIRFDQSGLVPVVTQDMASGDVLMLAYATREALEATTRTGNAHYWSRSRGEIWRKGSTSGNVQEVVDLRLDCDGDAILYRVRQTGAACHTLEPSCFYRQVEGDDLLPAFPPGHILSRVDRVVGERAEALPDGSYTTYLFREGLDKILKKVGEETTEVVIAAKNGDAGELTSETADLLFHLLVLLRQRNLPVEAVWNELEERFGQAPRDRTSHQERNPAR